MIITVEPGIYIPKFCHPDSKYLPLVPSHFRGIGVRVEDDILITRKNDSPLQNAIMAQQLTCDVLTEAVPKTVVEIENLMA